MKFFVPFLFQDGTVLGLYQQQNKDTKRILRLEHYVALQASGCNLSGGRIAP